MNKTLIFIFISLSQINFYAQDSINYHKQIPVTRFFYNLDKNVLGSFKYHYGINYILGGAATVTLIATNTDWNWYRYTYKNRWIYNTGYSAFYAGNVLPYVIPVGIYSLGRIEKNSDLQITALTLGQAAISGFSISILLKIITGRVPPVNLPDPDDINGDFRFGFLKGGIDNGWPSSHTCTAFAMASSLAALYPDNIYIKIGAYTYATYIGLGVSTNVHWFSDVVAGALIGYAIGTNVGRSFRNLMDHQSMKSQALNIYFSPFGANIIYKFD